MNDHGETLAQQAGLPLHDPQAIPAGGVCGAFGNHVDGMYEMNMARTAGTSGIDGLGVSVGQVYEEGDILRGGIAPDGGRAWKVKNVNLDGGFVEVQATDGTGFNADIDFDSFGEQVRNGDLRRVGSRRTARQISPEQPPWKDGKGNDIFPGDEVVYTSLGGKERGVVQRDPEDGYMEGWVTIKVGIGTGSAEIMSVPIESIEKSQWIPVASRRTAADDESLFDGELHNDDSSGTVCNLCGASGQGMKLCPTCDTWGCYDCMPSGMCDDCRRELPSNTASRRQAALEDDYGTEVDIDPEDDDESILQELMAAGLLPPGSQGFEIVRTYEGIEVSDPKNDFEGPLLSLTQTAGRWKPGDTPDNADNRFDPEVSVGMTFTRDDGSKWTVTDVDGGVVMASEVGGRNTHDEWTTGQWADAFLRGSLTQTAGRRTAGEGDENIFGYSWEDIQRAQQGQPFRKTIDTSKPGGPSAPTQADMDLLAKHGPDGLESQGLFGVIDRLKGAGLMASRRTAMNRDEVYAAAQKEADATAVPQIVVSDGPDDEYSERSYDFVPETEYGAGDGKKEFTVFPSDYPDFDGGRIASRRTALRKTADVTVTPVPSGKIQGCNACTRKIYDFNESERTVTTLIPLVDVVFGGFSRISLCPYCATELAQGIHSFRSASRRTAGEDRHDEVVRPKVPCEYCMRTGKMPSGEFSDDMVDCSECNGRGWVDGPPVAGGPSLGSRRAFRSASRRVTAGGRAGKLCDEAMDHVDRAKTSLQSAIRSGDFHEPNNEDTAYELLNELARMFGRLQEVVYSEQQDGFMASRRAIRGDAVEEDEQESFIDDARATASRRTAGVMSEALDPALDHIDKASRVMRRAALPSEFTSEQERIGDAINVIYGDTERLSLKVYEYERDGGFGSGLHEGASSKTTAGRKATASYGWIIDKDHLGDGAEGKMGPRGISHDVESRLNAGEGEPFKMWDDDNELYYTGRFIEDAAADGFEPLDDFGAPNAGCTGIGYRKDGYSPL